MLNIQAALVRIKRIIYVFAGLLLFGCTQSSSIQNTNFEIDKLPKWTWAVLGAPAFEKKYAIDLRINPFYLQADFDKDGSLDIAVLIKEKASGKPGLLLLRNGINQPVIFGAGNNTPFNNDDLKWLKTWKTETVLPAGAGVQPVGATLILFPENKIQPAPWLFWNGNNWQWKTN